MLHINDLTYRIQGRTLFEKATIAISQGHNIGLVGPNGSGKSTLFRLIMGDIAPDAGQISIQPRTRVGMVSQDAPSGQQSLIDTVLSYDTERAKLVSEADSVTDAHRLADIHTRLADIDAHSAPARAAKILNGLGFDETAQSQPCASFSGGWRMRVALAGALFAQPDLLLLDEPSNHLDLEAVLWLENHLANWPGTLVIISHERTLLNAVAHEIIHLDRGKLVRYPGNYDRFEKTRSEKMVLDAKLRSKQLAEHRRIQAFVDRFRAKATKARQAQSRLKMLERMGPIASVVEDKTISFTFPDPDPLAPPLLNLENIVVGYNDIPVLKDINLRIDMDDRIGILGANGNGKSTLIKLLSDRLRPMAGAVRKSSKLGVGYFAQNQLEELSPDRTPLEELTEAVPMSTEAKLRAQLGRFGFGVEKADVPIKNLSGGEKARLLFSLMSRHAPHIMFLDEPTNHLDVDSREALVEALNSYDGAVILVSHDAHLINMVCDRLWIVADGRVRPFDGDIEDYKRFIVEKRRGDKNNATKRSKTEDKKSRRQDRARLRAELQPLRHAAREAERVLQKLQSDRDQLEVELLNPELYSGPSEQLTELNQKLANIKTKIEETEIKWIETAEALEIAEQAQTIDE